VGKGTQTRNSILEHAAGLATQVGLEGISIGRLAEDLQLSKSGLFAHFQSKESLQLQTLEHAAARFIELVARPSVRAPRGEARVRALFKNWMLWPVRSGSPGGCFFASAILEYDDRPGLVRERLVELQKDWLAVIANVVGTAIATGEFRGDVDPEQFAHDLYGIILAAHLFHRLLRDPKAKSRSSHAFEALISAARSAHA
jgi:AcrR family transcriptional regulator